ncbi:hypothetical protein ACFQ1S_46800, partial [Kibdelosporangium lantanae]
MTLHPMVDAGDAVNVVRVLRDLDAAQRKSLADSVRSYEKSLRTAEFVSRRFWSPRLCALSVAGAALLPTASSVAVWLGR